VKKLVLLSVAALMLASSVFAPVAMAQEPAELDIQSVTVEPDEPWDVTGTIQCTEGSFYFVGALLTLNFKPTVHKDVIHKNFFKKFAKKPDRTIAISTLETRCETTGPQSFSVGDLTPLPAEFFAENSKVWLLVVGEVFDFTPEGRISNRDVVGPQRVE
jgi:hypothetical protein